MILVLSFILLNTKQMAAAYELPGKGKMPGKDNHTARALFTRHVLVYQLGVYVIGSVPHWGWGWTLFTC